MNAVDKLHAWILRAVAAIMIAVVVVLFVGG